MRKRALITRARVMEWLMSFEPRAIIGHGSDTCDCPLARYLEDAAGVDLPSNQIVVAEVDGNDASIVTLCYGKNDGESIHYKETVIPLPKWAALFVKRIDQVPTQYQHITSSRAIKILENV